MILEYKGKKPVIDESCFVADNATVIGNASVGADSSVWFGAVIRADNEPITVGARTSIQENVTVHCDPGHPVSIGDDVTVGHNAVVHGCTVGNGVLVGMGSVVLDDAVIGDYSIVGAGAVVTQGMQVPPYSLVVGVPGKVVKTDRFAQKDATLHNAQIYVDLKNAYKTEK